VFIGNFLKKLFINLRNKPLERLYLYRPKEVYWLSGFLGAALFLNISSLFKGNFGDIFEFHSSPVYQMISSMGNSRFRYESAETLYWILALIFVFFIINKAKKISKWLWNE
jgi:hypothetical protein